MAAAVWSSPPERIDSFPARTLMRFWHNHGFLGLDTQHPWRTVSGGSREYVKKLTAPFADRIVTGNAVTSVTGTRLTLADGSTHDFDRIIFASHGDQSLALLADPTALEKDILGKFHYQPNRAVVHTDERFMPRTRRAWASWNYHISSSGKHSTHYWMNSLQGVSEKQNYFVSINPPEGIDPKKIHHELNYEHPLFTTDAITAQSRIPELHEAARIGRPSHTSGSPARMRAMAASAVSSPMSCASTTDAVASSRSWPSSSASISSRSAATYSVDSPMRPHGAAPAHGSTKGPGA
jgi:predicted NAD/FAD-binding protein